MRFWAFAATLAALGFAQSSEAATVVSERSRLWPTSTVDFVICDDGGMARLGAESCKPQANWLYRLFHPSADGPELGDAEAATIRAAISRWNARFGANLRLREAHGEPEGPYIVFRASYRDDLCSTRGIGYVPGERRKYISIGSRCGRSQDGTPPGAVLHEIMHAVGFYHEQQRGDRTAMIRLHENGTALRENEAQWQVLCSSGRRHCSPDDGRAIAIGEYDFGSIMHYAAGPEAGRESGTYLTAAGWQHLYAQGLRADDIGQRDGFSAADVRGIEALYPTRQTMAGVAHRSAPLRVSFEP